VSDLRNLLGSGGTVGTDGALLRMLRNVQGAQGTTGAQGPQGPAGPPGTPGSGSETYVFLGALTTYTLADGTTPGQRVGIKDNAGTAQSVHPVINGNIQGGATFTGFTQNYAAYEFVWDGATWQLF
jgi:hypothetical protein